MNTRKFGGADIEVGEIGMGCWAVGGGSRGFGYGPTDDATSVAAIKKACEMGATLFDTADVYGHGHSEEILGRALKDIRDRVFIATKVGWDFYAARSARNFTPLYIGFALSKSLDRLQTDYIDCYFLHNPTLRMIQRGDILEHMNAHKEIGQIRHYGVSVDKPAEALAALQAGPPDALQIPYNIFQQSGWDEVFKTAKEKGCAIIAREPLANGFLTGKYNGGEDFPENDIRSKAKKEMNLSRAGGAAQLKGILEIPGKRTLTQAAIQFALLPDAVTAVIPGAKTPDQVRENLSAADAPPLTDEEISKIPNW